LTQMKSEYIYLIKELYPAIRYIFLVPMKNRDKKGCRFCLGYRVFVFKVNSFIKYKCLLSRP
jgi:hypothetical protein